jgi:hypothetical protein
MNRKIISIIVVLSILFLSVNVFASNQAGKDGIEKNELNKILEYGKIHKMKDINESQLPNGVKPLIVNSYEEYVKAVDSFQNPVKSTNANEVIDGNSEIMPMADGSDYHTLGFA